MPDALVLAGGRPDPALGEGIPNKAFLPLLGRPMVEFVLAALRQAATIRRIALVGPLPFPPAVAAAVDVAVGEGGTMLDNVAAGFDALGGAGPVLVAGADIPLVTPRAIDAFVRAAQSLDAEIVYGVVRREDVTREFPRARKTSVRLRDGTLTGGSLILMAPQAFARARPVIERAIRARKRPWEQRRAAGLLGVRARALICAGPEICMDVDTPAMLAVVRERLTRDPRSPSPRHAEGMARW
ncbi:MAG: hypothetical protein E6H03_03490 [Bacillati bacterium ANGP1]|uniref:MobA-like NTP transferase domain-containing protein n=1 Tax=Candidatus Segetimicrobium genomatis TaxID=2569760 RepID=A0A537JJ87_9BACT|nr:MAG: hypothetical protein E6H03_03490 [Terrabacteria group bacterium ANGP1]